MKIKVMTFNLRTDVVKDGINYFPNRVGRILETIRQEVPDLIGFQEAREMARKALRESLSEDYVVLGCGRKERYSDEGCVIAFRKDAFELINYETRLLSTHPTVPASRFEGTDQSVCPRMYLHAELQPIGEENPIHFFDTHLDHRGETAKVLGMSQILQHISACEGEFVLVGDMNSYPDSQAIALALAFPGMKEATESLECTFHDFGKRPDAGKIDYIFTNATPTTCYRVEDEGIDGVYITDHYVICADIEFGNT